MEKLKLIRAKLKSNFNHIYQALNMYQPTYTNNTYNLKQKNSLNNCPNINYDYWRIHIRRLYSKNVWMCPSISHTPTLLDLIVV